LVLGLFWDVRSGGFADLAGGYKESSRWGQLIGLLLKLVSPEIENNHPPIST
jgi:hypothetical protein